jgi:hypothetical protein
MTRAWPRFLPEPQPEAIAHALFIEAYAILSEELGEGVDSLRAVQARALGYAQSHYRPDQIEAARAACAAAPENRGARVDYLVGLEPFAALLSMAA